MPTIIGMWEESYLHHKRINPAHLTAEIVLLAYIKGRRGKVKLNNLTLGPYARKTIQVAAHRLVSVGCIERLGCGVYIYKLNTSISSDEPSGALSEYCLPSRTMPDGTAESSMGAPS